MKNIFERKKKDTGELYVTATGKIIPPKTFRNVDCRCARKRFNKISEDEREKLIDNFWAMGDINCQNSYLNGLCTYNSVNRLWFSEKLYL